MRDYDFYEPILNRKQKREMTMMLILIVLFAILVFYFPIKTMADITILRSQISDITSKIDNLTHKDNLANVTVTRNEYVQTNQNYQRTLAVAERASEKDVLNTKLLFSPIWLEGSNISITSLLYAADRISITGTYKTRLDLITFIERLKGTEFFSRTMLYSTSYDPLNGPDDASNAMDNNKFSLDLIVSALENTTIDETQVVTPEPIAATEEVPQQ